jgi:hypothetical protein
VLASPVKEQCLYCTHVGLPKHLLEHVRQVERVGNREPFKIQLPSSR